MKKNPYKCLLSDIQEDMKSDSERGMQIGFNIAQGYILRIILDFERELFEIKSKENSFRNTRKIKLKGTEWRFMVWLFNTDVKIRLLDSC